MKCFIYCEWIDDDRLKKSMPTAQLVDTAFLPDHRLMFATFVEDEDKTERPGGCHLVESRGDSVPGLLYELTEEEKSVAEALSRVGEGRYTPVQYQVVDSRGTRHNAVAYVIKHPFGPSTAPDEYREHMLNGARNHGFPEAYLRLLETI
jgi:gamma-glutamylcyclotransferase